MGIVVDGEHLTHLRFAADILLISHKMQELQTMIHEPMTQVKKVSSVHVVNAKDIQSSQILQTSQHHNLSNEIRFFEELEL